ncbi:hypothetical protein [Streptomyces sp. RKAG293]|uniref:hypothetical protein n=1 Tax=Streptomyces sp. RKAG293 TaxID=2893403 RepID=UPI0020342AC1|nr:hypothetical protein [Streptomyces sp. RKAG293]MCM2416687.1 hypothetical protein [Streptomyces sp. RKAG293]
MTVTPRPTTAPRPGNSLRPSLTRPGAHKGTALTRELSGQARQHRSVRKQIAMEPTAQQEQGAKVGDLGEIIEQSPHPRGVVIPDGLDDLVDDLADKGGHRPGISAHI